MSDKRKDSFVHEYTFLQELAKTLETNLQLKAEVDDFEKRASDFEKKQAQSKQVLQTARNKMVSQKAEMEKLESENSGLKSENSGLKAALAAVQGGSGNNAQYKVINRISYL